MTDTAVRGAASSDAKRKFYSWMAITCLAVAIIGFMPTYFLPMVQGRFQAPPIIHIHGAVFFAWTALFCVQTFLVANGATLAHRTWGLLGIAIATSMVFLVLATVVVRINMMDAAGYGAGMRAFSWVQVSGIVFFATVFAIAIVYLKKPEIHKRLMLLGTISLLDAPIARWFLTFLAPPPPLEGPPPPPPVFVSVPPAMVADLFLIAAIVFDWRTRGRPHPVYLIGGGVLLLLQLTRVPVSATPLWDSIAAGIARLGG